MWVIFAMLLAAASVLAGCGGSRTVPLRGQVVYSGQGVANVNVTFYGQNGIIGRALTDSSGRFDQVTWRKPGDGLPPGEYKVTITPQASPDTEDYSEPPPPPFPRKYLSLGSSDLRVLVGPETSNIVLELKD